MPTKVTRYKCNKCHTYFSTEEEASECEKTHYVPSGKILNTAYRRSGKYPFNISIEFEGPDGNRAWVCYARYDED